MENVKYQSKWQWHFFNILFSISVYCFFLFFALVILNKLKITTLLAGYFIWIAAGLLFPLIVSFLALRYMEEEVYYDDVLDDFPMMKQ